MACNKFASGSQRKEAILGAHGFNQDLKDLGLRFQRPQVAACKEPRDVVNLALRL